jgi:hypothetical protein
MRSAAGLSTEKRKAPAADKVHPNGPGLEPLFFYLPPYECYKPISNMSSLKTSTRKHTNIEKSNTAFFSSGKYFTSSRSLLESIPKKHPCRTIKLSSDSDDTIFNPTFILTILQGLSCMTATLPHQNAQVNAAVFPAPFWDTTRPLHPVRCPVCFKKNPYFSPPGGLVASSQGVPFVS